jgi:hypothetical protein
MKVGSLAVVLGSAVVAAATTLFIGNVGHTSAAANAEQAGPIYAQLSSAVTQLPKSGALTVQMESNDALSGLVHEVKGKTGDVVVKTPGVYFVVAAAQVGKEKGDTDEYVDLWIKQNGKDVDNSNTRQSLKDPKFTAVLVCQGIMECKAGDVINVAVSQGRGHRGDQAEGRAGHPEHHLLDVQDQLDPLNDPIPDTTRKPPPGFRVRLIDLEQAARRRDAPPT